ncbi:MAG TPA: hypothetical protein VGG81_07425 [Edaphobacter sp.]|jgi:Mn2+/Fe2+ NRAMP family transporter
MPLDPNEHYPTPIGGWLLIYGLSRGVLEPVSFVFTFQKLPSPAEKVFEICFAMAGFVAVLLIGKRHSIALKLIGVDLVLRACFTATVFLRMLLHPSSDVYRNSARWLTAPLVATVGLAFTLAWFLYFKTSTHVRETLGRNLET